MKIRRVLFSISLCIILITLNVVPVSAAETIESSLGFYVSDMDVSAYQGSSDGSRYESTEFTYVDASYGNPPILMRKFTVSTDSNIKILLATESLNLNSDHEYNLDFYFATDFINTTALYVDLVYYSSQGEELKRQRLDLLGNFNSGNNHYSSDFKPDTSDLSSSYNIRLEIAFLTPNSNTCSWRISNVINLTDKDDNSDWYAKIYNAIIQHDANVDSAVAQLETKLINQLITLDSNVDGYIATLDNHIKIYLDDLGADILAAISSLDSNLAGYIKSFQDTLIANDNRLFEALKEFLHNEMNPGVYEDPGEDEYQSSKDEFEQIESELPTFDSSDMQEVDISNYSGGFGAVRYLFDRFIAVSGLETLLSFSLMFGLGVFLIGRKVGG